MNAPHDLAAIAFGVTAAYATLAQISDPGTASPEFRYPPNANGKHPTTEIAVQP